MKKSTFNIQPNTSPNNQRTPISSVPLCYSMQQNNSYKNSIRAQDDFFLGFNILLETVIKNLLITHILLNHLNGSVKDSHFYICGMVLKFPQKRFKDLRVVVVVKDNGQQLLPKSDYDPDSLHILYRLKDKQDYLFFYTFLPPLHPILKFSML